MLRLVFLFLEFILFVVFLHGFFILGVRVMRVFFLSSFQCIARPETGAWRLSLWAPPKRQLLLLITSNLM